MHCVFCGQVVPDKAAFCPYCGQAMPTNQSEVSRPAAEPSVASSRSDYDEVAFFSLTDEVDAKAGGDSLPASCPPAPGYVASSSQPPAPAYVTSIPQPVEAQPAYQAQPAKSYAAAGQQSVSQQTSPADAAQPLRPASTTADALPPSPYATTAGQVSPSSVQWENLSGNQMEQPWKPAATAEASAAPSMRWYQFLIYFYCWAQCVFGILSAVTFFSYDETYYAWLSAVSPTARIFDVLAGILCLVAAAYAVFVRFRLSKHKADAPFCTCLLNAVTSAPTVLGTVGVGLQHLSATGITNLVGAIAGAAIWYVLNDTYFKKRAGLFVN